MNQQEIATDGHGLSIYFESLIKFSFSLRIWKKKKK